MRSRVALFLPALLLVVFVLPEIAHASIPFFGPIVPQEGVYSQCPANWGMIITIANHIIEFAITILFVFIAPLLIAYAGFLMVLNPTSAGDIEQGKKILLNMAVGLVVALGAWMIIDAVMVVLYNPEARNGQSRLGAWSDLISTGNIPPCLPQQGSLYELNQAGGARVVSIGSNGGAVLSLPTSGDCEASKLMAAAAGSAYPLTQSQANTLSCIAVPESRCGNVTTGARTVEGKPTSASGMFQIVFGYNDTCHNLNIPACSKAAGVSGNLNCSSAFKGGLPAPGEKARAEACKLAASNLDCNVQAASCLVQLDKKSSAPTAPFSAWTPDSRSATQKNCIAQYANK